MDDRLDALITARMQTATPPPREVARSLARFAPPDVTAARWRDQIAARIAALRDRADGGELPALPAAPWSRLVDKLVPGLALGVAADDARAFAALAKDDGWAAAIVARSRGAWQSGPPPTPTALAHALVWRHFALPGTPAPRGIAAPILGSLLQHVLGGASTDPRRLVRTEAARLIGAPRGDARALRDALVRMWLADRTLAPASLDGTSATLRVAARPAGGGAFVDRVRAAAGAARDGAVFGGRKVFIAAIWDALRADPTFAVPLHDLKAALVAAHRAGALELARADYTQAMDGELVRRSETSWDGASYHFVVREEA